MYPGCLAHVVSGMFYSIVANRHQPNLPIYTYKYIHIKIIYFVYSCRYQRQGGDYQRPDSLGVSRTGSASDCRRGGDLDLLLAHHYCRRWAPDSLHNLDCSVFLRDTPWDTRWDILCKTALYTMEIDHGKSHGMPIHMSRVMQYIAY